MRLTELRKHIKSAYLDNNVISGREAKDLVNLLAKDGLSTRDLQQLGKVREEFKDKFSSAGLRAFDQALAQAAGNRPAPSGSVGDGGTVMDVRLGRTLPEASSPVRLASVEDADVRRALRRLDFNNDGVVDVKDRDKMGFDDAQWRSFLYFAALMGQQISSVDGIIPDDFGGMRVAFTAVPDKAKAKKWAKAMGAKVTDTLDAKLNFLIVGNAAGTAKDERAHALNALGEANITVADYASFSDRAAALGVTGPAPTRLSAADLQAAIKADVEAWYDSHIRGAYEDELASSDPAERARATEDMRLDLDNGAEWGIVSGRDYRPMTEHLEPGEAEYRDRFGVPIPNEELVEVAVDFYPEYAGIGLGVYLVYDGRTGDRLDESDIHD